MTPGLEGRAGDGVKGLWLALLALAGLIADGRAGATPRALLRAWWPGRERGAALLLALVLLVRL